MGIIDTSYCGNNDIWKMSVICINRTTADEEEYDSIIHKGDRIAQFKVVPTMEKLLCNRRSSVTDMFPVFPGSDKTCIRFIEVDDLGAADRRGFGSTGKN